MFLMLPGNDIARSEGIFEDIKSSARETLTCDVSQNLDFLTRERATKSRKLESLNSAAPDALALGDLQYYRWP